MSKKASLLLALLALSGCLGGGGGSSTPAFSTLRAFSDGAGVAAGTDDGLRFIVITPDVAGVVSSLNNDSSDSLDSRASDFPIVQVLSTNANLRQGALTVNGIAANMTIIQDLGGDAALALIEAPTLPAQIGFAFGQPLTGTPVGTHTYNGTMTMGVRGLIGGQQIGSFSMGADFSANTYTFTGTTANNSLSGSGVIDAQAGTFSSNNLTAVTTGTTRSATMHGQLHGNGATSVSGVFHTNESSPTHAGGFVGSR